MKKLYSQVRRLLFLTLTVFITSSLFGQTTYTWNVAGGGAWTVAGNWTPLRNTPATNDILVFNNAATYTVTGVPAQTIGKLQISGNTNITLVGVNSGTPTLTVSTAASDAITVAAGSTLQLRGFRAGGNNYTLTLTTANTSGLVANINGTVIVTFDPSWPLAIGVFTKGGANATINFNAGSLYTHNVDASLIPQSTWSITSTCNITGVTDAAPSQLNQAFGNFTWSSPSHSVTINLNGALNTINGNFTVNRAGSPSGIRVANPLILTQNTNTTLTVGGNFILSNTGSAAWFGLTSGTGSVNMNIGGNFNMSNNVTFFDYNIGASQNTGSIVTVAGNYAQTGGFLDWAWTPTTGTGVSEMYIAGNFSLSGNGVIDMTQAGTASTVPNGKITFNKNGTQTISVATLTNLAFTNFQVNSGSTTEFLSNLNLSSSTSTKWGAKFEVLTGGIIDMNTYSVLSSTGAAAGSNNSFILNSGAGIITANANGIQNTTIGSISTSLALRIYSSGANYTYDGTVIQNSGIFATTPVANQVNNLTINNTAGKYTTGTTLQQPIAVAGTCYFTRGVFTTTSANLLTFNDNAIASGANNDPTYPSFVNGPTRKIGDDVFTFPVGKVVGPGNFSAYMLCGISAPANTTDAFNAEFMRASASALGPVTAIGLVRVSACEYWNINRTAGSSPVNITLSWSGVSNCNGAAYVTNLSSLVIAHFGTSWDNYGNDGGTTGTVSSGTITWNSISAFNGAGNTPFSLGSTSQAENPLPVKFTFVTAYKVQPGNKVEWTNMTEESVVAYEIEKSDNGRNFYNVFSQQPRMNNGSKVNYSWIDVNPNSNITYYRIKATDIIGAVTYSPVVKVQTGSGMNDVFTVYPNPVISHQFAVQLSGKPDTYKIRLLNNFGQEIMNTNWQHSGGVATRAIELSPSVSRGVYHLQIIGNDQTRNTKIYIQ